MLFSFGIREKFDRVVLVDIPTDSYRVKTRSISITEKIVRDFCEVLGLSFSTIRLSEIENPLFISRGDVVDIAVYRRVKNRKAFINPIFIAVQVEHISVLRPNIFYLTSPALKKRLSLVWKTFLPNMIFSYYSLAPRAKKHWLFKEKTLNYARIEFIKGQILHGLMKRNEYSFLKQINNLNPSPVCFFLPTMSRSFQDPVSKLDIEMFNAVLSEIEGSPGTTIIVKNHPQDHRNFKAHFKSSQNNILFLSTELERQFPLELLSATTLNFRCIGAESTAYMSLQYTCSVPPLIYYFGHLPKSYWSLRSGEIRKLYSHSRVKM